MKHEIAAFEESNIILAQQVAVSNERFDSSTEVFGNALMEIQSQLALLTQGARVSSAYAPSDPLKSVSDSKSKYIKTLKVAASSTI